MCFSACMIDGYCERDLSGKATKVSEDGKVLHWGNSRAFKGDAAWQYNNAGKLILVEHHNVEKVALIMLFRGDRETFTMHNDIRFILKNEHIYAAFINNRMNALVKHGYVRKYTAEQTKRGVVTRKFYYELTTLGRKEARGLYYENHAGLAA